MSLVKCQLSVKYRSSRHLLILLAASASSCSFDLRKTRNESRMVRPVAVHEGHGPTRMMATVMMGFSL